MELQAGQWDSSVCCLFEPFFGILSLFSQLGTLLFSVLVSATHFLSVPLDLAPSVCLACLAWPLGPVSLSQSL